MFRITRSTMSSADDDDDDGGGGISDDYTYQSSSSTLLSLSTKTITIYLILLIIVSTTITPVVSMKSDRDITISGQYYMVESFGFDDGGTVQFTTTVPPQINQGNLTFWMCEDRDFKSIIGGSSSGGKIESKLCDNPSEGECIVRNMAVYDNTPLLITVNSTNMYRLILLVCSTPSDATIKYDLSIDYSLKNPDGYLPVGYLQLPKVYLYITIITTILFISYNYMVTKNRRYINEIHYILIFVLVLKLVLLFLTLIFYQSANNSGKWNMATKYLQNIFFSLQETSFFGMLLLISKGWRITRNYLPPLECRTILSILSLLLAVLLFFSFYNDVYYFLSLMILYLFMMPKIFTNITKNLRLIASHLVLSRYTNNSISNRLEAKKKLMHKLRTAVVIYLGAILVVNSMRVIMVWNYYWITLCIAEPVALGMLWYCCYILRPFRRNNIFIGANLDSVNMEELTRSLEGIISETSLDPLSISSLLNAKNNFDPRKCIFIQLPYDTGAALGVFVDTEQQQQRPSKNKR